jgi:hypothetical protein
MKPLHIGLLIVGAALAGGLAMKMTDLQPVPPVPVASSPAIRVPAVKIVPASEPAVQVVPPKPSPMPPAVAPAPAAPAPVYLEPVHIEQVAPKSKPVVATPVAIAPVVVAKIAPPPPMLRPVPYERPPQPEPQAAPALEPPPPAPRRTATLPAGMTVAVRLNESLSSERGIAGDSFNASLSEPLVIDGLVIAERGARARGRIVGTQRAGRVSGTSSLDLELTMVETSDGQKIEISTAAWTKRGDIAYGADAAKIGGGAVLGAIIGAAAGGGKGAAIGAGAGGVLGAGAATLSRGKPVNVPSETIIRFRLASRVTIAERQL